MTILYLIIALAAGVLLVSYMVFRIVFLSPNRTQNDDYNLYYSEQMDPLCDTILDMIRTVNAIPFEPVSVMSTDGLRLSGSFRFGYIGNCLHNFLSYIFGHFFLCICYRERTDQQRENQQAGCHAFK